MIMNMKNLRQSLWSALFIFTAASLSGAEIRGTVRDAADGTVSIITPSQLFPNVGDKAEIFFLIPGGEDEVPVGKGQVSAIDGDTIKVKIATATGRVTKNQLARIFSDKPVQRPPALPPPVVPTKPPVITNPLLGVITQPATQAKAGDVSYHGHWDVEYSGTNSFVTDFKYEG